MVGGYQFPSVEDSASAKEVCGAVVQSQHAQGQCLCKTGPCRGFVGAPCAQESPRTSAFHSGQATGAEPRARERIMFTRRAVTSELFPLKGAQAVQVFMSFFFLGIFMHFGTGHEAAW